MPKYTSKGMHAGAKAGGQVQRYVTTHQQRKQAQEAAKPPQEEKKPHATRKGTEAGAVAGSAIGPEGTLIGAGVGAATGASVDAALAANRAERKAVTAPIEAVTSHTHSGILFWGSLLLVMATWKSFWSPTIVDTMWKNQPWTVSSQGKREELGGIVFVLIMAMAANYSDEMESVFTWLLVALWILFIVMNGTGTIKNTFAWFGQGGTPPKTPAPDPCSNLTGNAKAICEKNRA